MVLNDSTRDRPTIDNLSSAQQGNAFDEVWQTMKDFSRAANRGAGANDATTDGQVRTGSASQGSDRTDLPDLKIVNDSAESLVSASPNNNNIDVRQAISDLNHDRFAVRERAQRDLIAAGGPAVGPLLEAIRNPPSPEVMTRAQQILNRMDPRESVPELLRLMGSDQPEVSESAKVAIRGLGASAAPVLYGLLDNPNAITNTPQMIAQAERALGTIMSTRPIELRDQNGTIRHQAIFNYTSPTQAPERIDLSFDRNGRLTRANNGRTNLMEATYLPNGDLDRVSVRNMYIGAGGDRHNDTEGVTTLTRRPGGGFSRSNSAHPGLDDPSDVYQNVRITSAGLHFEWNNAGWQGEGNWMLLNPVTNR